MTLISRLRSATWLLPVAALSLAAVACGASPEGNGAPEAKESTGTASEALTGANTGCTSSYSCAGIVGAPPDIIITCPTTPSPEYVEFDVVDPSGNKSFVDDANSYQGRTSDYAGSVAACTLPTGVGQRCDYFSTYSPVTQWCPGSGSSSGGSSSSGGGRGGCHGTCM